MANKIFKNLKASFEGIKDVISKLEDRKVQQQDINELQQQIQSKEAKSNSEELRLMSQQMMTKEHLKNKHLADMNDL